MRHLRVGFRAYLLLITLASLIAATCAVRMRAGYRLSALDHEARAHDRRILAAFFGERAEELRKAIAAERDPLRASGMRYEMKANRERYLELIAEAEHHEQLASWYLR